MANKSVLIATDLSLVGRCSSMAALPIFACLGINPVLLPNMLLSSHTMFENPKKIDLSDYSDEIIERFEKLELKFDGLYIGYIGSKNSFSTVYKLLNSKIVKHAKIYLDPIMGDNGRMYSSISEEYIDFYKKIAVNSDIIFPNMTEASLLSDGNIYNLSALNSKNYVLKGIEKGGQVGVELSDKSQFLAKKTAAHYPGTGDIFASIVIALDMLNFSLKDACNIAVNWLSYVIETENEKTRDKRFGLAFEKHLKKLMQMAGI